MATSLRHLNAFRLLMQTRNVTETARLLRVSQPAVSQTLKELEVEFGLKLFVRRAGRISPTAEARLLVPEADKLFLQLGMIDSRAAELRDARAGSLSVSSIPAIAGSVLPRAFASFRAERPHIKVSMDAFDKGEVVRRVRTEEADLGLIYGPADDPDVVDEPLAETSMVCVLPHAHPLSAEPAISLRQLFHQTVIVHPSTSPSLVLNERLQLHGPRFEATLETNFSFGAIELVKQGVGIYITEPVVLLSAAAAGLPVRPFEPRVPLLLAAVYARRRAVPRVLMRFMATFRDTLGQFAPEIKATGAGLRVF